MISFKDFLVIEDAIGKHGEYVNDVGEKTMVNKIIGLLLGGQKTDQSYDLVYSFIEAPESKDFYDKYYDAFAEYAEANKNRKSGETPKPLSPKTSELIGQFKKEVGPLFKKWKDSK